MLNQISSSCAAETSPSQTGKILEFFLAATIAHYIIKESQIPVELPTDGLVARVPAAALKNEQCFFTNFGIL